MGEKWKEQHFLLKEHILWLRAFYFPDYLLETSQHVGAKTSIRIKECTSLGHFNRIRVIIAIIQSYLYITQIQVRSRFKLRSYRIWRDLKLASLTWQWPRGTSITTASDSTRLHYPCYYTNVQLTNLQQLCTTWTITKQTYTGLRKAVHSPLSQMLNKYVFQSYSKQSHLPRSKSKSIREGFNLQTLFCPVCPLI